MAGLLFQSMPVAVTGAAMVPVPSTQFVSETAETAMVFVEVTEAPNRRILAEVTMAATSAMLNLTKAWRLLPTVALFFTSMMCWPRSCC